MEFEDTQEDVRVLSAALDAAMSEADRLRKKLQHMRTANEALKDKLAETREELQSLQTYQFRAHAVHTNNMLKMQATSRQELAARDIYCEYLAWSQNARATFAETRIAQLEGEIAELQNRLREEMNDKEQMHSLRFSES